MLRRSATTGLVVEASWNFHATVGVLSLPKVCVRQAGEALMELKMASWRTSTTNLRSELVMLPSGLVNINSSWEMSAGHLTRQV